ncbi:hypothetical protein C1H76_6090 [Elsinoe australis]|uniref:Uncharacterized protein n=1 Tax=Elsinoe australis TaxID=40998 RepID=A0A4U7B0M8_9PEZI|nr:hypothetical protein C1H76_6090 [Elsinoe australis]
MPLRLPFLDAVTRDMSYITSKITPVKSTSPTSPDGTSDPRLEAWIATQTVSLAQPPNAMPPPGTTSTPVSGSVRPGLQRSNTTLTRTTSASQRVYESRMSTDYSIQRSMSRRKRDSATLAEGAAPAAQDPRPGDVRRSTSSAARPGLGPRDAYKTYDSAMLRRPSGDSRRVSGESRESGSRSPGAGAGYGMWVVPDYPKLPKGRS